MAKKAPEKVKIKLLRRILVEGEGKEIGDVVSVEPKKALAIVSAKKATFDLEFKIDPPKPTKK